MTVAAPPRAPDTGACPSPDGTLRMLRADLQADRVTLVRFEGGRDMWEVIAADGVPLIADAAALPTAISTLALDASEGHARQLILERGARPLDRVAVAVGMASGASLPLYVSNACVGAVVAEWAGEDAHRAIGDHVTSSSEGTLLRSILVPRQDVQVVLVCHEDPLLAGGIARMAESRLGVGAPVASSVQEAAAVAADRGPDVIVASDRLAPDAPVSEAIRALRASGVAAPLIVLSAVDSPYAVAHALEAGAVGYVSRQQATSRLPDAIAEVLAGRTALPDGDDPDTGPRLTRREHDVLRGFDQGLSDKEIAISLGISASTVKTHARRVYTKLDSNSRTRAVNRARVLGLI